MWQYLYGDNNRVIEYKFDNVLDQIKCKLTHAEQKTLKTHREMLKKCLKKRMASGRRYRSKQKLVGKSVQESRKSGTIDLTGDDDSETPTEPSAELTEAKAEPKAKDQPKTRSAALTESEAEPKAKAERKTRQPKAKAERKTRREKAESLALSAELTETEAEPKAQAERKTRREKAKAFANRIHELRNTKKVRKQTNKAKTTEEEKASGEKASAEDSASGKVDVVAKTKKGKKQATKRKLSTAAASPKKKRRSQRKKTTPKISFQVGTRIARDFDGVLYTGEITKLYPDDPNVCEVTYSDGDTEDLESDQVHYATQLYARDWAGK